MTESFDERRMDIHWLNRHSGQRPGQWNSAKSEQLTPKNSKIEDEN